MKNVVRMIRLRLFSAFLGVAKRGVSPGVISIKLWYRCSSDYRMLRRFIPRLGSSVLLTGRPVFLVICLGLFFLLLTNGYAGSNKILIHYEANTNARRDSIISNASWIDSLPFDGIVVNSPDSFSLLSPGNVSTYSNIYTNWLAPLKGVLHNVTHNYYLIEFDVQADPFDDWTQVIANWVVAAEAARDAGFEGIYFDNEGELGNNPPEGYWTYPTQVKYGSTQTLPAYQKQYYLRGQQVMSAIIAHWPACKLIYAHSETESDSNELRTPPPQVYGSYDYMCGFFSLGMFSAAPGQVIDGGEQYRFRTASDFSTSALWIKSTQPGLSPALILPSIAGAWASQSNLGFGVYDETWGGGSTMTPSVFQACITNALTTTDYMVWTYTDVNDYLQSSGSPSTYITAIWNARAAAGLPNPGPTPTPVPTATPIIPLVSNVQVSNITSTTATISWNIFPASTGQVAYGTTNGYGSFTTLETNHLTFHRQNLSGLQAGTVYHYQIIAIDSSGNSVPPVDLTFSTTSPGGI